MELNGALSNPQARVELGRLRDLCRRLRSDALLSPRRPHVAPARVSPVLETVTLVLELAEQPMRAIQIHAAAEALAGRPLKWSSVKGALAAYACGEHARFRRISNGVYENTSR